MSFNIWDPSTFLHWTDPGLKERRKTPRSRHVVPRSLRIWLAAAGAVPGASKQAPGLFGKLWETERPLPNPWRFQIQRCGVLMWRTGAIHSRLIETEVLKWEFRNQQWDQGGLVCHLQRQKKRMVYKERIKADSKQPLASKTTPRK